MRYNVSLALNWFLAGAILCILAHYEVHPSGEGIKPIIVWAIAFVVSVPGCRALLPWRTNRKLEVLFGYIVGIVIVIVFFWLLSNEPWKVYSEALGAFIGFYSALLSRADSWLVPGGKQL